MADRTSIEWTAGPDGKPGATWNPIIGCSVVSPGCTNCYAMRLAGGRLRNHPSRAGLTQPSAAGPVWNGIVRLWEPTFREDFLFSKRPRRVFVCAHGDLFHEAVPDDWIDRVFAVMAVCSQHTFLVLTKRAARMRDYLRDTKWCGSEWCRSAGAMPGDRDPGEAPDWPLRNVWLGVSVEDQRRANERIPELLATPAAVRWISAEPLLGPIDLDAFLAGDLAEQYNPVTGRSLTMLPPRRLDWIVCGGESGPGARPMPASWARSLRDQCISAGVPFFFKQWGEWIDADEKLNRLSASGIGINASDAPTGLSQPLNYGDAAWLAEATGYAHHYEHHSDGTTMIRVGKRSAGRLLDGRTWDAFPAGAGQ